MYNWWKMGRQSSHRETATDRLTNVIQVIELGRKTGVLTVERNTGLDVEEGFIYFVRGRITHASVGQHTGLDALKWLNSWGACRFTFVPSETSSGGRLKGSGPYTPIPDSLVRERVTETDPALRIHKPFARQQGRFLAAPHTMLSAPYRTRQLQEALLIMDRMGLSRAHRRLFLLVDGQRLVPELARLMGRRESEIYELLQDLKRSGLIGA